MKVLLRSVTHFESWLLMPYMELMFRCCSFAGIRNGEQIFRYFVGVERINNS